MKEEFKSGFVAIVGKPNVGKSTILNYLLKQKVAIVSDKPETTRDNIQGILNCDNGQIIFIDTPGIHNPHLLLGHNMVRKAKNSLFDADLILFIVDVASGFREEDQMILQLIKDVKKPCLLLINKIDKVSKSKALPIIDGVQRKYDFLEIIPISAIAGDNMEVLKEHVLKHLSSGEKYYPDEQFSDKNDAFFVSEIIREKVLMFTHQEVPHSVAVELENFAYNEEKEMLEIGAVIYVERESQKGIIIGQKGEMIKKISTISRKEIEDRFGRKVFLNAWVKVLRNWRKDPIVLKKLGMV
ncbi:MAG: GTPase Era [Candidatus Omnitrophota bacterium]